MAMTSRTPSDLLITRRWYEAAFGYNRFSGAPTQYRLHVEGCPKLSSADPANVAEDGEPRSIAAAYSQPGADWCKTCLGWAEALIGEIPVDYQREKRMNRGLSIPEQSAKMEEKVRRHFKVASATEAVFVPVEDLQPSWEEMDRNRKRRSDLQHADHCFVCQRGLTESALSNAWWCHLVGGGSEIAPVDLDDSGSDTGDMGWFPLGSECAKKVPITHRMKMAD
jgi:hypothetical protein